MTGARVSPPFPRSACHPHSARRTCSAPSSPRRRGSRSRTVGEKALRHPSASLCALSSPSRHGRACPGHPRLRSRRVSKTWIPACAGMTVEGARSGGGWRGDVLSLFLTSASTLAISLHIPARRGARSRGVAVTGRGTVLRQVSHTCRWEAARCKTRCPPQRTVREEPSGSSHRHTRAGRLLAPSLDLTPSRHSRREDARARPLGSLTAHHLPALALHRSGMKRGSACQARRNRAEPR